MSGSSRDRAQLALERRVAREASRFDLRALVRVLETLGWPRERLVFEGNPEPAKSAGVVEKLSFRRRSPALAVVTVNLGLLGDGTLLPSYFTRAVERSASPELLEDFLRFFDHQLVSNHLAALWPEDDPSVHKNYGSTRRAFLGAAGWGAVAPLHALAQAVWPELGVRVERESFRAATAAHGATTGRAKLDGSAVLGRTYEQTTEGFLIELIAEEEADSRGRNWAAVARLRFREQVLPLLGGQALALHLRLRVRVHESWAKLQPAEGGRGFLGYDRLEGDPEAGHVLTLFRGRTSSEAGS